jgi:hypothetical protein
MAFAQAKAFVVYFRLLPAIVLVYPDSWVFPFAHM